MTNIICAFFSTQSLVLDYALKFFELNKGRTFTNSNLASCGNENYPYKRE